MTILLRLVRTWLNKQVQTICLAIEKCVLMQQDFVLLQHDLVLL